MDTTITAKSVQPAKVELALLLKTRTSALHERLDSRIISHQPFADRERYARFLRVQYRFQRAVEDFCTEAVLRPFISDIAERRRLALIEQDLADLDLAPPPPETASPPRPDGTAGMLGWLYVAEGSTLGAAFLIKEARKLGLDETFGARHLAAHSEGRGLHWRNFTQALNAAPLSEADDERAVEGAAAAFACVHDLVEAEFA